MRQIMHRKSNLKEELKSFMFPLSGPICISEDEALFMNIMITFYQHEQSVSHQVWLGLLAFVYMSGYFIEGKSSCLPSNILCNIHF